MEKLSPPAVVGVISTVRSYERRWARNPEIRKFQCLIVGNRSSSGLSEHRILVRYGVGFEQTFLGPVRPMRDILLLGGMCRLYQLFLGT
ncbi:hypothetical protein NG798_27750, partial [Ancylothrix sp. C2]